jgi:hypothetical protein
MGDSTSLPTLMTPLSLPMHDSSAGRGFAICWRRLKDGFRLFFFVEREAALLDLPAMMRFMTQPLCAYSS